MDKLAAEIEKLRADIDKVKADTAKSEAERIKTLADADAVDAQIGQIIDPAIVKAGEAQGAPQRAAMQPPPPEPAPPSGNPLAGDFGPIPQELGMHQMPDGSMMADDDMMGGSAGYPPPPDPYVQQGQTMPEFA